MDDLYVYLSACLPACLWCWYYLGLPPILLKQVPYTCAKFVVHDILEDLIYHQMPVVSFCRFRPRRLRHALFRAFAVAPLPTLTTLTFTHTRLAGYTHVYALRVLSLVSVRA